MEAIIENLHNFLFTAVTFVAIIIEMWGLIVIGVGFVRELIRMFREYKFNFHKANADNSFNHALSTGLEVLLAAEILKTITIDDFQNLVIIGVLVVLRIVMTLLLVWEADHREQHNHPKETEKIEE